GGDRVAPRLRAERRAHRGRGAERRRLLHPPVVPAAALGVERGRARGGLAVAVRWHRQAGGDLPRDGGAAGGADRRQVAGEEEGLGDRGLGQRARGQARQVMRSALLLALLSASPALAAVGSATVVEGPVFRTPKGGT